ncbi:MAG: bifunctional 3,4-dihydroxy-2-butanone-4-phosphate synthase/GTP cyclohydrolase II [Acidobacteriota bacterium]|nr:bifunctional 3,4-dihydroxy-2-butanone-4-phosphate synthase/GTP cyclohydrolase II [Acidobacteriota bacterium]
MFHTASVEEALKDIRRGRMVLVCDSSDRENEADLIMAAQRATPANINFMIRHGGGLICAALSRERALKLGLTSMVPEEENTQPFGCNFTVSVDARKGVTTGISAADRAATLRVLANPRAASYDLARPGHVFPVRARAGGVLDRAGHTEAAVDLARLAGFSPVGVMCEVLDENGKAAHAKALNEIGRRFRLKLITIEQLIDYRKNTEKLVDRVATAQLPTEFGTFVAHVYSCPSQNREHLALVMGRISPARPALVRVHSQCLTGDTLHSVRCDCREQLCSAMHKVAENGEGVILYLSQEGRGIGLTNKIRAYALQDKGLDTVQANEKLGLPADMRDYSVGAQILADLGVRKIHLLTNNPQKISGIERYGLHIVKRIPLETTPRKTNRDYLKVKKDKLGHLLSKVQ